MKSKQSKQNRHAARVQRHADARRDKRKADQRGKRETPRNERRRGPAGVTAMRGDINMLKILAAMRLQAGMLADLPAALNPAAQRKSAA